MPRALAPPVSSSAVDGAAAALLCIGFRVYHNSFYSCRVAQLQLVSRSCAISSIQQLLQQQFSSCTLAHRHTHAGNVACCAAKSQLYNCSLSCESPSVHLPVVNTSVAKH
ncbi:TPA: hypothetical protein ACH3X1_016123 [Trebouxia sp. C0004]